MYKALLLGLATAYSQYEHMDNEMLALSNMMSAVRNPEMLTRQMEKRGDELESLSKKQPQLRKRFANELESLSLVDAVEGNDMQAAEMILDSRQKNLMKEYGFTAT